MKNHFLQSVIVFGFCSTKYEMQITLMTISKAAQEVYIFINFIIEAESSSSWEAPSMKQQQTAINENVTRLKVRITMTSDKAPLIAIEQSIATTICAPIISKQIKVLVSFNAFEQPMSPRCQTNIMLRRIALMRATIKIIMFPMQQV